MKYIILICGLMTTHFLIGIVGYNSGKHPNVIPLQYKFNLPSQPPLRDYQIHQGMDSAYLYDGETLIGVTAYGEDGIDSLILLDNL